jgi:DNA-binding NarL/FixJ family response regulator
VKKKTNSQPGVTKSKRDVLIIDDHPLLREGLAKLIDEQKDLRVCGSFEEGSAALQAFDTLDADIVVVDLCLKGTSGIEVIKELKQQCPSVPTLVLSMYDEPFYTERALRSGARGYISKRESPDKVIAAIRHVLSGYIYLSDSMETQMLNPLYLGKSQTTDSLVDRLSDRELEVFQLLGRGHETREMADKLKISSKTVQVYREHIKEKLNLENSTQLIQQAALWVQSKGLN